MNGVLIDDKELEELQKGLEEFPNDLPVVTARAINYAVKRVRTESWRAVSGRYNIKQSDLYDRMTMKLAYNDSLNGSIVVNAPHTPIGDFIKGAKTDKGMGPKTPESTFAIIKGSSEVIGSAFVATMPTGHTGLFVRVPGTQMKNKKKEQIRELFTIGVKEMIDQSDVEKQIDEAGINAFNYEFGRQADLVLLRKE